MRALSIRQPWVWLIVNGHKPVENRNWVTHYRGPVLIHASQGMTRAEYDEARELAESLGVELPDPKELERGGIVGHATTAIERSSLHHANSIYRIFRAVNYIKKNKEKSPQNEGH